jgi:hypothetical protein
MTRVFLAEIHCRVCRRVLTHNAVLYAGKAHCYRCGLDVERDEALQRPTGRRWRRRAPGWSGSPRRVAFAG